MKGWERHSLGSEERPAPKRETHPVPRVSGRLPGRGVPVLGSGNIGGACEGGWLGRARQGH